MADLTILIGLVGTGFGVVNLIRPFGFLRVTTRKRAAALVAVSLLLLVFGIAAIPLEGGPFPPVISDTLDP